MTPMENSSERGQKQAAISPEVSAADQARLNLSLWTSTLGSGMRDRQVKFMARDYRPSMTWSLLMPKRCWLCDESPAPRRVEFRRTLRGFNSPLAAVAIGFFVVILGFAAALIFRSPLLLVLSVLAVAVVPVILHFRSWNEEVRLVFFSCERHASELECPPMALHEDDLSVFMPTPELAQRTREMILAERRKGGRYLSDEQKEAATASTPLVDPMLRGADDDAESFEREDAGERRASKSDSLPPTRSLREELPPIRLEE